MKAPPWRARLRYVAYLLLICALTLWGVSIYHWIRGRSEFEAWNVLAAALVSTLLSGLSFLALPRASAGPMDSFFREQQVTRAKRNRMKMIQKVRNFWIAGVLEDSLHDVTRFELGLEYKPEAVSWPPDVILQQSHKARRRLPPGVDLRNLLQQLGGTMLILGEPGSGKTTTLLELARDLLEAASGDDVHPIPVVFNLSSWGQKRLELGEWLVEELSTVYQVNKRFGQEWIRIEPFSILLDGLDEVHDEHRGECVEAINHFCQEYTSTDVVVCCRTADYECLTARFQFGGAIEIQPLSERQVDTYLAAGGGQLAAARVAVGLDPLLRQLSRTPLALSVLALAYSGITLDDLKAGTLKERHAHLFDAYVQQMFNRRKVDSHYTRAEITHYLVWLARMMLHYNLTMFHIERIQPDWLEHERERRHYSIASATVVGLVGSILIGLALTPNRYGVSILDIDLLGGPLPGFAFGLILGLGFWRLRGWPLGLIIGAGIGLAVGMSAWSYGGSVRGLRDGLVNALAWGPLLALILKHPRGLSMERGKIEIVEKLSWSWRRAGLGVAAGIATGAITGIIVGKREFGFVFGALLAAVAVLTLGFTGEEIEDKSVPNQGIKQSARTALQMAAASILVSALAIGISFGLSWGFRTGILGTVLGLAFGIVGLLYGGFAVIQHTILRVILYRNGCIPWDYERFLDYSAKLIFLRKVGGGYIFVHRMLLEHFAAMTPSDTFEANTNRGRQGI